MTRRERRQAWLMALVIALGFLFVWLVVAGVVLAVMAPNGAPGVAVAVVALAGLAACVEWIVGRG